MQSQHKKPTSIFLGSTGSKEIIDIIRLLKNKVSTGADGIYVNIVKSLREELAEIMSIVINKMFTGGRLRYLKKQLQHQSLKTEMRKKMNNYRPISIIPTLAKIALKVINARLSEYLNKNKIISERLFQRENYDTECIKPSNNRNITRTR